MPEVYWLLLPQTWQATPRRRKGQGNAREGARGQNLIFTAAQRNIF